MRLQLSTFTKSLVVSHCNLALTRPAAVSVLVGAYRQLSGAPLIRQARQGALLGGRQFYCSRAQRSAFPPSSLVCGVQSHYPFGTSQQLPAPTHPTCSLASAPSQCSLVSLRGAAALSTVSFLRPSRPNYGVIKFKLADIGEGISEVELLRWYLEEGATISEMDPVCEVQSDKSAVEISSPYSGKVLKFHHAVGDIIKIGKTLMDIEVHGAEADASEPPSPGQPVPIAAPTDTAQASPKPHGATHALASPACRYFAMQHNIKLEDVPATGPGGRVLMDDVKKFVEAGAGGPKPKAKPDAVVPPAQKGASGTVSQEVVLLKTGIQKGMVKSMNASLEIPTMSIQEDVDLTELSLTRERLKKYLLSFDQNAKITITTLLVKALSKALIKFPVMNSKFDVQNQDRYTIYHHHHISIAIDTPIGLLVPNIKNVESLSLMEIQAELNALQQLAMDGKLGPSHLTGGTISISNVGVIGGISVRSILFDGQTAILGFGRVRKLPYWNEQTKAFEPRDVVNITATVDHRHVNGATVARFMKCLREMLEQPDLMML